MVRIFHSNRFEKLVDLLARAVEAPLSSPTMPELIAVQSQGTEMWLNLELAKRFGVWSHAAYPFPRALLGNVLTATLGGEGAKENRFEREQLTWGILALLPELEGDSLFEPIQIYLRDDPADAKCFQFAQRMAHLFDEYATYRPEMVLGWQANGGDSWQSALWCLLTQRYGVESIASKAHLAIERLQCDDALAAPLPERINLFGLSTLPPLYLNLLGALAKRVEVNLFVLSPCREYWHDIVTERHQARAALQQGLEGDAELENMHFDVGHPMLASLGTVGREFQQLLLSVDGAEVLAEHYDDPAETHSPTLLQGLQSHILNLRGSGSQDTRPLLRADDDSLAIHACHSPTRELEVIRDQLQAIFDADSSLGPDDVVCMAPDIDAYAPSIEAVLGAEQEHCLPYAFSDCSVAPGAPVFEALFRLLRLVDSRLEAPEVFDLLAMPVVRERFDIGADDFDGVCSWLRAAGVRWGLDDGHREALGLPTMAEHSWRFALDRLMLGYAMPDNEQGPLFEGVAPFGGIEGHEAERLGHLAAFCDRLFFHVQALRAPRPMTEWRTTIDAMLGDLMRVTLEGVDHLRMVREALEQLTRSAERVAYDGVVPLAALRRLLEERLSSEVSVRGFMSGQITFCKLLPMRGLPFRVVVLMGMHEGAYPRREHGMSLNLMDEKRCLGDRSAALDDRYLFLETLLSARDRLIMTYVGQSIRDNTKLAPSLVISELLDVVTTDFDVERSERWGSLPLDNASAVRQRLLVEHPLHPYNRDYFTGSDDSSLFSYDSAAHVAASTKAHRGRSEAPFFVEPLIDKSHTIDAVSLDELIRFFKLPVDYLLQRRLGIWAADRLDETLLREPIELDALERSVVGRTLLTWLSDNSDVEEALIGLRARGLLPMGTLGEQQFRDIAGVASHIDTALRSRCDGGELSLLHIDGEVGGVRLTGRLDGLTERGQILGSFSRPTGALIVEAWLKHLVLNWGGPHDGPRHTSLVCRGREQASETIDLSKINQPEGHLAALVELYKHGMQAPLRFFPGAGLTYVQTLLAHSGEHGEQEGRALDKALSDWAVHAYSEGNKAAVRMGFGDVHPLLDEGADASLRFGSLARQVFEPIVKHWVRS